MIIIVKCGTLSSIDVFKARWKDVLSYKNNCSLFKIILHETLCAIINLSNMLSLHSSVVFRVAVLFLFVKYGQKHFHNFTDNNYKNFDPYLNLYLYN